MCWYLFWDDDEKANELKYDKLKETEKNSSKPLNLSKFSFIFLTEITPTVAQLCYVDSCCTSWYLDNSVEIIGKQLLTIDTYDEIECEKS